MTEVKVPQLRFEGHGAELEERSLGDLGWFGKGQGYSKADLRESGSPIFMYGRIYTNFQIAVTEVDTFAQLKPGAVLSTGNEVLVPSSGETSEDIATAVALLEPGVIIGGDLNVIRPAPDVDPVYLALRIGTGSVKQALSRRAQGKSVVHLRNSDLRGLQFGLPQLDEQKQVGAFLSELDALIGEHGRKHAKLQQAKVSLLQRMFPQGDSDEPALRIEGYGGPWRSKALGDLGTPRAGFGFPDAEQGGQNGVPFYKVSDMNLSGNQRRMTKANNYVSDEQIERRRWRPIHELPAILFAKVGAAVFLGRKRVVDHPFLMDNNMIGYSIDCVQWDPQFARVAFANLDLSTLVQVGALPSFNPSAVGGVTVLIPQSREEQEAIGALFSGLDELIAAELAYIKKLQQAKTGLMQKLFA